MRIHFFFDDTRIRTNENHVHKWTVFLLDPKVTVTLWYSFQRSSPPPLLMSTLTPFIDLSFFTISIFLRG